jgi:hypothetical protein
VQNILKETNGEAKYKHHRGEISTVGIDVAVSGTKRRRVANLPTEGPDTALKTLLPPYGKYKKIQQELWTHVYRCIVSNGIRQVTITFTKHIPSHLTVAENRVLLTYEGQPFTCYLCGETGFMLQTCPKRRHKGNTTELIQRTYYVAVAAQNEPNAEVSVANETKVIQTNVTADDREQMPLTKTHTDTESDDIMMDECNDTTPIMMQNTKNT